MTGPQEPRHPNADEGALATQAILLSPVATFVIDQDCHVIQWNHACERLTGIPAAKVLGTQRHRSAFYGAEKLGLCDMIVQELPFDEINRHYGGQCHRYGHFEGAIESEAFFPSLGKSGLWLHFMAVPLCNAAGERVGAAETLQDVSARHNAEEELHLARIRTQALVESSSVATFAIDLEHRITHWNRACELLTGFPGAALIGTQDAWKPFYSSPRPVMANLVLEGRPASEIEMYYSGRFRPSPDLPGAVEAEDFFPQMGNGGRWLYFTAAPLLGEDGRVIGAIETLQDFTERKRAQEALQKSEERYRQLSLTDALTSLGNSRGCYADLDREVARSRRYGLPMSVLLLDADEFKAFNDRWGHLEGDRALVALARAIRSCLRRTDSAYRYGGEEFVVLLPQTTLDQAALLAERIRIGFAETPLTPAKTESAYLSVSIGCAQLKPDDTVRSLLARADQGTYLAKAAGRNRVVPVP